MYALLVAAVVSFGVPGVPETPEVPDVPDVPDIPALEVPGLALLDSIATELDDVAASVAVLEDILPELQAIDNAADKLRELNDMDPEIAGVLEDLEIYRGQLLDVREELTEIRATIIGPVEEVRTMVEDIRSQINDFASALPGIGG